MEKFSLLLEPSDVFSHPLVGEIETMAHDTANFHKLRRTLDLMTEDRDPHMNAREMQVFLLVALTPGLSMKTIAERVTDGRGQSEISRIVLRFSALPWTTSTGEKRDGYGLLKFEENPEYRKEKQVSLTPKGARLADKLSAMLN